MKPLLLTLLCLLKLIYTKPTNLCCTCQSNSAFWACVLLQSLIYGVFTVVFTVSLAVHVTLATSGKLWELSVNVGYLHRP